MWIMDIGIREEEQMAEELCPICHQYNDECKCKQKLEELK